MHLRHIMGYMVSVAIKFLATFRVAHYMIYSALDILLDLTVSKYVVNIECYLFWRYGFVAIYTLPWINSQLFLCKKTILRSIAYTIGSNLHTISLKTCGPVYTNIFYMFSVAMGHTMIIPLLLMVLMSWFKPWLLILIPGSILFYISDRLIINRRHHFLSEINMTAIHSMILYVNYQGTYIPSATDVYIYMIYFATQLTLYMSLNYHISIIRLIMIYFI